MAVAGGLSYYFMTGKNSIDDPTTKTKPIVSSLLKVDSSPSGAQIFVNGSFRGRTPMELKVPSGKCEIRLSLPEYYEWEAQLRLNQEEETPLFVRLIPIDEKNP